MANLYKKPVTRTDPQTGERVKGKSKKWWGHWRDADGKLCRHPLSADKAAAQAMLNEIVRRVEREKAGLVDPTDEQARHFRLLRPKVRRAIAHPTLRHHAIAIMTESEFQEAPGLILQA